MFEGVDAELVTFVSDRVVLVSQVEVPSLAFEVDVRVIAEVLSFM